MNKFTKFVFGATLAAALFIGVSAFAAYDFGPYTLKQGDNNMYVASLQQALNANGANPALTTDGAFGPMTKSALMAYQSTHMLTADGIAGPATKAKLNETAPVMEDNTDEDADEDNNDNDNNAGDDFDGTEGDVKSYDNASAEESSISEGEEEVELVAFDVELDDEGDLELNRVDFYMEVDDGSANSTKPWDYFEKAYLMIDGDIVADMDAGSSSDWDESDNSDVSNGANDDQEYKLRFSDLEEMLASDETTTVSIGFDATSNIDGSDEGAEWDVAIISDSFRFTDGTGFVFTDGDSFEDSFDIDSEEVAELEISASTDDLEATVIEVSDSADTTDVEIGMFEIEEKQEVDVTIEEMEVVLTTNDAIGDVVKKAYLFAGDDMIGEESVSGVGVSDTVVFDNLGFDIDGDTTEEFTVKVDFDDTDDQVRYQNGDTIDVTSVTITEADDEFENDESDITFSGSYSSETHELRSEGISVEVGDIDSASISIDGANNDRIELTIEFDVTAFSEDVYVVNAKTATGFATTSTTTAPSTTEGVGYHVQYTGTAPDATTVTSTSLTSTAEEETNSFLVEDGQTETFTLKVVVSNDGAPDLTGTSARAILAGIGFGDSDSATADSVYSFDLSDFKTEYEIIAD